MLYAVSCTLHTTPVIQGVPIMAKGQVRGNKEPKKPKQPPKPVIPASGAGATPFKGGSRISDPKRK